MLLDLSQLNVSGVIHAGAHWGNEYAEYCKQDSIKKIYFFECDKNSFKVLYSKFSHNDRVCMIYCALGSEPGKKLFYRSVQNYGQSNSLLKPKLHKKQYPDIVFDLDPNYYVEVAPLDVFKITNCNLLNMDVQGYELEVLKGATETLRHVDYVYTEVNRAELYEGCCMVEDIDAFLAPHGFKRVETKWIGGTWGDAFYVKGAR